MNKTPSAGTDGAGALKRLSGMTAHPPQERSWDDIARLVEDIGAATGSDAWEHRVQAAFLLAARTHAAPAELTAFYASLLPRLGPAAVPLALTTLLARMEDDPKFVPDLAEEMGAMLPHAVNRVLADRHPVHEPLRDAARECLAALRDMPVEDATTFLDQCIELGVQVAFPVAQTLLDGPYGTAVHDAVQEAADKIARQQRPDKELAPTVLRHCVLRQADFAHTVLPLLETKHGPTLAAALQAVIRGKPGRDAKLAVAAAKAALHPDRKARARALAAFMACAPKDQGRILASLCKKDNALREFIPALLPFLPGREYDAFMKFMGKPGLQMLPALTAALGGLDPEAVRAHLDAAAEAGETGDAASLAALFPERDPPPESDADAAVAAFKPVQDKPKKPAKKEKESIFSIFGGGGSGGGESISIQFEDAAVSDSEHSGKKVSPIYEDRTLTQSDFSRAFLDNAVFIGCTFVKVRFQETLLRGARFAGCVFENCDLSGARFYDCSLSDVVFSRTTFRDGVLSGCTVSALDAHACDIRGLGVVRSTLRTCRFTACDLTGLRFFETSASGFELVLSRCLGGDFHKARLTRVTLASSAFGQVAFCGLYTDNASLMRLEDSFLLKRAEAMVVKGLPAPPALPSNFLASGQALTRTWFANRELRASALAFQENNARRESWCLDKLGPDKAEFYRLAPLLLHSEIFEKNTEGVEPLPLACRMAVYEPDYTTLETARRHFEDAAPPPHAPDPINIEALYTIGSVGTVAQTPASDLDYWVCYDPEDMPAILVDSLTEKLERIEKWADEVFGLEVHFFTMDLVRIQQNNFGFSDQESSGSAQALLLKEEFYRTAVSVAGRVPLWWFSPVGANDEQYAAIRDIIRRGPSSDLVADLGNLDHIPPSEFFGASLWQIVKALKSPFKSIMKFGLLEKYIAGDHDEEGLLLCDHLKANLVCGRTSLNHTDPYMLLFREVSGHYSRSREKDSLTLVRLSFFLKTKVKALCAPGTMPMRQEEAEIIQQFSQDEACPDGGYVGEDWSFERLEHIGELVNKFIVRTYMRVRDKQSKSDDIAITPQDLTKLGRKIFSSFSKRKHKIEHVPFLSIGGNSFKVLHFQATGKKMGRPTGWEIQGAQAVSSKERLQLVNLRKGPDLAQLLVWLSTNKVFVPGVDVRGDYSISPVTVRDIAALLERLAEFFPVGATFNTDIGETLEAERITRAFFILNLVHPREQDSLSEVTVVYSTNWGELFCVTLPAKDETLLTNPSEFLLQNVEQEFSDPPMMDFFIPDRSSCPRPPL